MVFLKLQPYIQASIAPRANHKLLFKYYGPFRVVAKVRETTYKLDLPAGSTIHLVFHVSLLRKMLTDGMPTSSTLPSDTDHLAIPFKIMSTRWRKKANAVVEQVLVQWTSGDAGSATWEDREELTSRFPRALAWGQAGSQGGGGVSIPNDGSVHSKGDDMDDGGETDHSNIRIQQEERRTTRPMKPNRKYVGPTWVQ
uniref:Uncharacterized protein n=1 Tax=Avena sativa TaxID=4498 RepID=A0ACD5UHV7_AVESA